jgi:K+-sensing histidine kinase KdpD
MKLGDDVSYALVRVSSTELEDQAATDFRERAFAQMTTAFVHDLSQPLTAAITNTEASLHWLQAEKPDLAEAKGAIRNAVENQRRAGRILARMRNDATPYPKRNEELALKDIAESSIAQLKAKFPTSFLDLQLESEPALPLVTGDRVTLEKVFVELLLEVARSLGNASTGLRVNFRLSRYTNGAGTSEVFAEIGDRSSYRVLDQLSPHVPSTVNEHSWVRAGSNMSLCRHVIEAHSWILQSFVGLDAATAFRVRIPIKEGT